MFFRQLTNVPNAAKAKFTLVFAKAELPRPLQTDAIFCPVSHTDYQVPNIAGLWAWPLRSGSEAMTYRIESHDGTAICFRRTEEDRSAMIITRVFDGENQAPQVLFEKKIAKIYAAWVSPLGLIFLVHDTGVAVLDADFEPCFAVGDDEPLVFRCDSFAGVSVDGSRLFYRVGNAFCQVQACKGEVTYETYHVTAWAAPLRDGGSRAAYS